MKKAKIITNIHCMSKPNIEPLNNKDIKETQKLVNNVFPSQNIIARLSFFWFTHRENIVVKLLMSLLMNS